MDARTPTSRQASGEGPPPQFPRASGQPRYDSTATRDRLEARGIHDAVIAKKRKRGDARGKQRQPMGLRWPVERTNSWLSNFGQLRRNTDRKTRHRLAQLALAVVFIITAKLIDWRNRWSPGCVPIR